MVLIEKTNETAALLTPAVYGSVDYSSHEGNPTIQVVVQQQASGLEDGKSDNADNHYSITSETHASSQVEEEEEVAGRIVCGLPLATLRQIAIWLSLYANIGITLFKLVAYIQTFSLSVLAALLDSVLDVVSQVVLFYTEKHSSMQRSSAFYPAGASRLEPIGVLICAALMGMASFEVIKESVEALAMRTHGLDSVSASSVWGMLSIVFVKLGLLLICQMGSNARVVSSIRPSNNITTSDEEDADSKNNKAVVHLADPTLEALAQDHLNDMLSNGIAAAALVFALWRPSLWFLDPVGALIISIYIIYSWFVTGKEQIEHLTGKVAPEEFIEELTHIVSSFDDRIQVDHVRAYHFGPKFLVELEVVMPKETRLFESHDVGMELQYEIEGREEVERCFVHIDYETRPYDEHVVSKVPELREKYRPKALRSTQSV